MESKLLFIFVFFYSPFLFSQNTSLTFSAQLGQGVNFAKKSEGNIFLDSGDQVKTNLKYSYHFGANLYIPFHKKYGLRVGLHYNQFNASISSTSVINTGVLAPGGLIEIELKNLYNQRIKSIAFPVVYESKISSGFFRLGLQYALFFDAQSTVRSKNFSFTTNEIVVFESGPTPQVYKESELGFHVSYSYLLTPYLSFDVQTYIGFLRLQNFQDELYFTDGLNRQFTLGVSYT